MSVSPLLLNRLELFQNLDAAVLENAATMMRLREFRRRDVVVQKGAPPDFMAFLIEGLLQVVDIAQDGTEVGLSFIQPGAHFGELAIIDGQHRSASIIALAQSKVLFMAAGDATAFISRQPAVALRVMRRLVEMVRATSAQVTMLNSQVVHHRVCALLLQLARPLGDDSAVIDALPQQRQLAIMVNTSRETVSRSVSLLIRKGYLQREGNGCRINSLSMLRREAEEMEP